MGLEDLQHNFLTGRVEDLVKWARRNSVWPVTFGLAFLGENVFQAAAFSVANLIILRTIGHDNPLAATQFGLLTTAFGLPLIYMQVIDGQAYGIGGVTGSYLADALVSGGACVALAVLLWSLRRRIPAI